VFDGSPVTNLSSGGGSAAYMGFLVDILVDILVAAFARTWASSLTPSKAEEGQRAEGLEEAL